jgi:hypothetical protein
MSFGLRNIEIKAKIPEVGRHMKIYRAKTMSLDERKRPIDFFREKLNLGNMIPIEAQESLHFVSDRGEIQFYRPSGGLWVRDRWADRNRSDERRHWKVSEVRNKDDRNVVELVLDLDEQKLLSEQARELFKEAGLLGKEAYFADVELDQITLLNQNGKGVAHSPGEANVKYLYKLDNVQVDGAGAKSYAFFNPDDGRYGLAGIYHCWREIESAHEIELLDIEQALDRAFSQDQELLMYDKKQYAMKLLSVDLVYFALPPSKFQDYIFPALRIVGSAHSNDKKNVHQGFEFSRFVHVALPESYAKSNLYADYLTMPL